jgi:uroporphyrinogen-III synthase
LTDRDEVKGTVNSSLNLHNLPVVVTRPVEQSRSLVELIREFGGRPIVAPVIEIRFEVEQLSQHLRHPERFDFVMVTSANAVRALAKAAEVAGCAPEAVPEMYAIGRKTKGVAERLGFRAHVFEHVKNAQDLGTHVMEQLRGQGQRVVLFPHGRLADTSWTTTLTACGHQVEACVCYDTQSVKLSPNVLEQLTGGEGSVIVLFFSPSAVTSFVDQLGQTIQQDPSRWIVGCIGETTDAACRQIGLNVSCTAAQPNERTLLETVAHYVRSTLGTR